MLVSAPLACRQHGVGRQADRVRALEAVTERGPRPPTRSQPEQLPGSAGRNANTGRSREHRSAQQVFVDIDVSKARLDVAARPGPAAFRLANAPDGLAELVERLRTRALASSAAASPCGRAAGVARLRGAAAALAGGAAGVATAVSGLPRHCRALMPGPR
jgi:hypothetical protein